MAPATLTADAPFPCSGPLIKTVDVARNELAEVVGPCWSDEGVVTALGVPSETVASWREAGSILGLPTSDGVWVYPVAQFERHHGRFEVMSALLPFLRALRGFDPWAVAVLMHTPVSELGDATPLDWLAGGRSAEPLARLGEVVAREWAAGTVPG